MAVAERSGPEGRTHRNHSERGKKEENQSQED
jgi:hypothetical protein